jgi:hypothetical protein
MAALRWFGVTLVGCGSMDSSLGTFELPQVFTPQECGLFEWGGVGRRIAGSGDQTQLSTMSLRSSNTVV